MSFCNKSAAQALKEIGFKGLVNSYYRCKSDYSNGDNLEFSCNDPVDWNHGPWYSAPTHLDAADWLADKHGITIVFHPNWTEIFLPSPGQHFRGPDHRNDAIISACKRVKGKDSTL